MKTTLFDKTLSVTGLALGHTVSGFDERDLQMKLTVKNEFLELSPIRPIPKPILSGVMQLFKGNINYSRKGPFLSFLASSIYGRADISFRDLYMSPLLSKDLKFDSTLLLYEAHIHNIQTMSALFYLQNNLPFSTFSAAD